MCACHSQQLIPIFLSPRLLILPLLRQRATVFRRPNEHKNFLLSEDAEARAAGDEH